MTNVNAVHLHDGFNFLLTDCPNTKQGAATSEQCLLLLTVARQPLGRTISMLCIAGDPAGQGPTSEEMECEISYSLYTHLKSLRSGNLLIDHHQRSTWAPLVSDRSLAASLATGSFLFPTFLFWCITYTHNFGA
jgi:E3 ubiquitin-protein ligase SIAH1